MLGFLIIGILLLVIAVVSIDIDTAITCLIIGMVFVVWAIIGLLTQTKKNVDHSINIFGCISGRVFTR